MWERENVLPHATRIKEIADKIEDAHRLNNNGQADNNFKQNLERDVIQCFIRDLRPESEIRAEEQDTFKEVINDTIDIVLNEDWLQILHCEEIEIRTI